MSPDRTTITRAEAIRRRKEEDQHRRDKLTSKRIITPKLAPKPAPRRESRERAARPAVARTPGRLRQRYDIAFSSPYGRTASQRAGAPSMRLPKVDFGLRWLSALIMVLSVSMMYYILTQPPFIVSSAKIQGNLRVPSEQIAGILGVANQSSALLNPGQIEYNILANFPDISAAYIQVDFPAMVNVTVVERQPVASWTQDGQVVWVDSQGYAFPPRGELQGLVSISAAGAPPTPTNVDPAQTIGARPFLTSEISTAILTLVPQVPEGATLVYDPRYGLGWNDPRGWQAYFGQTHGDMNTKLQVYQAMVDYVTNHNIQPVLISVEYPDAPYYRLEH